MTTVTIVGGGIAGWKTALALDRCGICATVYEATPQLETIGVGTNILPHASRVLHVLDLGDDAHPMVSRGSNGAGQAILEADSVARCREGLFDFSAGRQRSSYGGSTRGADGCFPRGVAGA
jgi:2-polyprenyl-6-methoxyphenol hydroxylase-like FAD-dependent oxidoreductase